MKLTDVEFVRSAPFVLGLRMLNEKLGVPSDKDKKGKEARPRGTQWEAIIERLQNLTVERSNQLADELGISFPDETERETPESIARYYVAEEAAKVRDGFKD